jgi:hydrogenase/urease accessory protein HupE
MAAAVYILCALTSVTCAVLLLRAFRRTHARLLFWSSLCFVGLAVNNVLLFVDLVVVPQVDLLAARNVVALVALVVMLFGLIWEGGRS